MHVGHASLTWQERNAERVDISRGRDCAGRREQGYGGNEYGNESRSSHDSLLARLLERRTTLCGGIPRRWRVVNYSAGAGLGWRRLSGCDPGFSCEVALGNLLL